jgi:glycosyltransferase involved in cell wall biosynthesis
VHVLFFTSALGNGGAEMHLLRLINYLDRKQFSLSLALARPGGTYESALARDIKVHVLNTAGVTSSTMSMIRSIWPLRRIIQTERPDILCSVMDHANIVAILACCRLSIRPKIAICVQNPPCIMYRHTRHIVSRFLFLLMPHLYPHADQVIALSQGVAQDLLSLVPAVRDHIDVIYNAGVDSRVYEGMHQSELLEELPKDGPLIVACGRLTAQKGFPYLIEALARVRQFVPAHLWIIGVGELHQCLEEKIRCLGLTNCVRLLGFQQNPYQYMAAANVFVLSSIFEGFGNVIVEAMACGTPVVATDCPYGPAEIINDGINGLLVPPADVDALSRALLRVLTDSALKKKLSQNGQKRSQDFHAQAIASAYGEMLLRVASGTKTRFSG